MAACFALDMMLLNALCTELRMRGRLNELKAKLLAARALPGTGARHELGFQYLEPLLQPLHIGKQAMDERVHRTFFGPTMLHPRAPKRMPDLQFYTNPTETQVRFCQLDQPTIVSAGVFCADQSDIGPVNGPSEVDLDLLA